MIGAWRGKPLVGKTTSAHEYSGSAPTLRQRTLDDLAASIPPEIFGDVVSRTLAMMDQTLDTLRMTESDNSVQRMEFHKMIAIAGNIGLEELSLLSRALEARVIAGEVIEPIEINSYLVKANQGIDAIRSYIDDGAA